MTPTLVVCGERNAGKTTWICALAEALSSRGLRVGTVKHTHHHYDVPGKDTHRHQEAGADRVVLASNSGCAVYEPWTNEPTLGELVAKHFGKHDLVLAEGYRELPGPKIIVGDDPRANRDGTLLEVARAAGSVSPGELEDVADSVVSWLESLRDELGFLRTTT